MIFITSFLAVILLVNYFYSGSFSLVVSKNNLFNVNSGIYGLIYLVMLKIGMVLFSTLSRASILAFIIGYVVVCVKFY